MGRGNPSGQLLDKYRAEVVSVTHPKGYHLAKVRVLVLWDEVPAADLPWAEYQLPLGARKGEGDAMPCKVGDLVWVEFPMSGDSRAPLITGSCYTVTNGASDLPKDLFESLYSHKRATSEPPAPSAAYGDKVVDLFGVLQQLTQGGAWCITHKASGSAFNITKEGKLVIHSEGNSFQSTVGDHLQQASGNLTEKVGGKLLIEVIGDADIKANNVNVDAKANMQLSSAGSMTLDAKGPLLFKGSAIGGITGSGYDFK